MRSFSPGTARHFENFSRALFILFRLRERAIGNGMNRWVFTAEFIVSKGKSTYFNAGKLIHCHLDITRIKRNERHLLTDNVDPTGPFRFSCLWHDDFGTKSLFEFPWAPVTWRVRIFVRAICTRPCDIRTPDEPFVVSWRSFFVSEVDSPSDSFDARLMSKIFIM